jgi:hypothetical protein
MSKIIKNSIFLILLVLSLNYALAQDKQNNKKFELNAEILDKYPGLQILPEEAKFNISAAYYNMGSVEYFLANVESGEQTGNIEYRLQFIGECLDNLKKYHNPVLNKFVKDYKNKFADVSKKAKSIVGNKKRGPGGIYK